MYVTDTPVIDRLTNPEPMELVEQTHCDMRERVYNNEDIVGAAETAVALNVLDMFADELATRLAAIQ